MVKQSHLLLVTSLLMPAGSVFADNDNPFRVIKKGQRSLEQLPHVLLENEGYTITREAGAADYEFADLYWVNMKGVRSQDVNLEQYGAVKQLEEGEFAIIQMSPYEMQRFAEAMHKQGMACGVAFRMFGDTVERAALRPAPVAAIPVATKLDSVTQAVQKVNADNIKGTIEQMSNIFSRHAESDTGSNVAQQLVDRYTSFANGRADVEFQTYSHGNKTPQPSLVVRIKGQTKPDEIVVLGSHIDSINYSDDRAPGADDNASGTAVNMEIFRVLMESGATFDRTIEIHGYAAEELGLVGSQDMAETYKKDGKNVVAMVQHDMVLYKKSGEDMIWFVTNNTNKDLNKDLQQLTDQYVGMAWDEANLWMGSSDHASWHRQGFAAAFPFEKPSSYNPSIHTGNDTIEKSGAFTQAAGFAKLGVAYLSHYAGVK